MTVSRRLRLQLGFSNRHMPIGISCGVCGRPLVAIPCRDHPLDRREYYVSVEFGPIGSLSEAPGASKTGWDFNA